MSIEVRSVYGQSLIAMLAAERGGLARMNANLDALGDHAGYASILSHHIAATTQQIDRLEKAIFEVCGRLPDTDPGSAAVQAESATRAVAPTRVLGNLYAGYGFLYEQIAAYTSIEVLATTAGFSGHKAWIEHTIREERDTAAKVDKLIAEVTRRFIEQG